MYRLAVVLAVFMMVISVVGRFQAEWAQDSATLRADGAEQDRDRLAVKVDLALGELDAQQRDLACFADNTTEWERAISNVIVSSLQAQDGQVTPDSQRAALEELLRVNESLAAAKPLCGPSPPAGTTTTAPR